MFMEVDPKYIKNDLLLVVPVYNEAAILYNKLNILLEFLVRHNMNFKLVISVDYSGDKSIEIVENFSKCHENVTYIVHNHKMGRGYAVREAWKLFDANYYSFIDLDLATGLQVILDSYYLLKLNKADLVTASRYVEGAIVKRPPLRNWISIAYNKLVELIFDDKILDHQCGFKIITQLTKEKMLDQTSEDSWFWDTELLVLAKSQGLNVIELGVEWVETKYSKTSFIRLLDDVYLHGSGILRLLEKVHKIRSSSKDIKPQQTETMLKE